MSDGSPFAGFVIPRENWTRMPNLLIDSLPLIKSLAEMKVVLYTLRHTWGFQEFQNGQALTVEEYMHGKKEQNGGRADGGTGMSKPSVMSGLKQALKHGFLEMIKQGNQRIYRPKMQPPEGKESLPLPQTEGKKVLPSGSKSFTAEGKEVLPSQTPSGPPTPDSEATGKKYKEIERNNTDSEKPESVPPKPNIENGNSPSSESEQKTSKVHEKGKSETLPWTPLTKEMHDAIPEKIRPLRPEYHKHNLSAKVLFEEGYKPEQIRDFVEWKYATDHWMWTGDNDVPVVISMSMVSARIRAASESIKNWIAAGRPQTHENPPRPKEDHRANGREPKEIYFEVGEDGIERMKSRW